MAEQVGVESRAAEAVPVSFQDLGIPAPPKLQDTVFGKARQLQDVEWKERAFMGVTVVTLLVTFAFTLYKVCSVASDDPDFTFALVLLVSHLFAFYYTIHGVLQERATELVVLCISMAIVTIYLIINYAAGKKDTIKLIRLVVGVVVGPVLVALGLYMSVSYYRSGNLIFRTIGANTQLQNMCQLLFSFFDVLKFDLQLSISMVIFILSSRIKVDTEDIVVLSVGGVLTLFVFAVAYDSMKRELKVGAIIFFVLSPLELAYIVYKLYQTSDYITSMSGLAGSTIACGILAFGIRVLLIIIAVFVYRNFNKGLKEKAFGIGTGEQHRLQEPPTQGEFVP